MTDTTTTLGAETAAAIAEDYCCPANITVEEPDEVVEPEAEPKSRQVLPAVLSWELAPRTAKMDREINAVLARVYTETGGTATTATTGTTTATTGTTTGTTTTATNGTPSTTMTKKRRIAEKQAKDTAANAKANENGAKCLEVKRRIDEGASTFDIAQDPEFHAIVKQSSKFYKEYENHIRSKKATTAKASIAACYDVATRGY
jgi:hypothetical protein